MKITKQQLTKIIQEELNGLQKEGEMDEAWFGKTASAIMNRFKPKTKPAAPTAADTQSPGSAEAPAQAEKPAAAPVKFTPPVEDATGEPAQKPGDAPAAPAQPPAAQAGPSPAAEKAKVGFIGQAKQYMNSLLKGLVQQEIEQVLGSGVSADQARVNRKLPVKEQVTATNPKSQAFLMTNALNKQVEALLNSLTTEEFAKIFADVAKQTLKDPKQLQKALKSFRLAEQVGTPDPTVMNAGLQVSKSFTSMLAAAMKLKGVNATQLVKKAFDSLPKERLAGLQPQQMNMAMGKAIQALNTVLSASAKMANDPNAGTMPAKPAPAKPAAPVPAAAPTTVQENKEVNRWKKLAGLIKG